MLNKKRRYQGGQDEYDALYNADGEDVVGLGSVDGEGGLSLTNADGELTVSLISMNGEGDLTLENTHGDAVVYRYPHKDRRSHCRPHLAYLALS